MAARPKAVTGDAARAGKRLARATLLVPRRTTLPHWARDPPPAASTRRRYDLYGWPQPGRGADEDDELWPARASWPADRGLRLGTAGWAYPHWLGRFYPAGTAASKLLAYYARRFAAVEVNSTYRRLPGLHVAEAWRDAVPPGFLFAVKAPKTITHLKRLVDVDVELEEFLGFCRTLRDRLGCVLFQMPPSFTRDERVLRDFLGSLPPLPRVAVELRHRSWHVGATRALLEEQGVAWVVHDFARKTVPMWTTAPFAYVRFHGPSGRYRGSYALPELLAWAEQIGAWRAEGREVWAFFNNDERGHGVRNAGWLQARLEASATLAPHEATATARERREA